MTKNLQPAALLAVPAASMMLESLRGLSYSTAAALADLIDNSISAGADRVDLIFQRQENKSYIGIKDNGRGLNQEELFQAMRLGFLNPRSKRAPHDLGRALKPPLFLNAVV